MAIDIITALTSLGIVGFLIYFFIYYRKPMRSVIIAIGDTDSLKAGPLEYKRRKQELDKALCSPDLRKALAALEDKSRLESKITTSQESTILDLEDECLFVECLFVECLFVESLFIAAHFLAYMQQPGLIEWVKGNRDKHYKEVKSKKPDSNSIALCDSMVKKLDYFPPIDDSQQSKP